MFFQASLPAFTQANKLLQRQEPYIHRAGSRGGSGGCNPLFSNRRGSIILYNFIRKEKISNAINNSYQVNPSFKNSWIRLCIHILFDRLLELVRSFLKRFISLRVIRRATDITDSSVRASKNNCQTKNFLLDKQQIRCSEC